MKQKNYKLLVCALAMANISAFSINNCFANVADNNVHENIVSAESLTEEVVAAKIDETMQMYLQTMRLQKKTKKLLSIMTKKIKWIKYKILKLLLK